MKFSHDNIRSVSQSPAPESFMADLFRKYGVNGSITMEKFSDLLGELGIGEKEASEVPSNTSPVSE